MGVRLTGDWGKLRKKLSHMAAIDPRHAHRIMAAILLSTTQLRFRNTEDPEGHKWKKSIRAKAEGGTTLTDSAQLKKSIHSKYSSRGAAVGTNKLYAAIHQFGGTIKAKDADYLSFRIPGGGHVRVKSVTIPARPFLGISDNDKALMRSALMRYIAGGRQ